jgi:four helix bundle protein
MATSFDLEARTESFAVAVRDFVKTLPQDLANLEYSRQVIRSSGSVGANYIEANEGLSRKDFLLRLRISRKEAKESGYWLRLIVPATDQLEQRASLVQEATELVLILSAIVRNTEGNTPG